MIKTCVLSSSGDASLLLKVNSCNGAYFRQTEQDQFVFSTEYNMFSESYVSPVFSFRFHTGRVGGGQDTDKRKRKNTDRCKHTADYIVQVLSESTNYLQYFVLTAWIGECAGFTVYTLQSLQVLSPQFIVDASLGHSWPHARQEQEAVLHSANTAHCCLSFSAGLTSQKHTRHGGVTVSHTGLLTTSHLHPHSITLIPKTSNLCGGSQRGFSFSATV